MSSVIRWEPMNELVSLHDAMDRLIEDSFVQPGRVLDRASVTQLPLDVYATPDAVVVRASVPGVNPDQVEITIEGSRVMIRGESQLQKEEGDYLLQEQRYGPFARILDLGLPVQADKAEASFKNGLLTLTIPKAEEIKPKTIKVKHA